MFLARDYVTGLKNRYIFCEVFGLDQFGRLHEHLTVWQGSKAFNQESGNITYILICQVVELASQLESSDF